MLMVVDVFQFFTELFLSELLTWYLASERSSMVKPLVLTPAGGTSI